MANLKTDYKDDILDSTQNLRRKFRMITNDDGTVSFEDVTEYSQNGDSFGASDVNAITNAIMNECLKRTDVVDNLESTSTDLPLSANMGRALKNNFAIGYDTANAVELTSYSQENPYILPCDGILFSKINGKSSAYAYCYAFNADYPDYNISAWVSTSNASSTFARTAIAPAFKGMCAYGKKTSVTGAYEECSFVPYKYNK